MKKVLITDAVHQVLIEGLAAANYSCTYVPNITYDEVCAQISDYHGLIINSKVAVNQTFIDSAVNLEFVARLGSGREVVDIPYAESRGIKVFFSPEGNSNAVAEHALGMLLMLANNLHRADREVRQKIWRREYNRGFELRNRCIGLIGFGHTGQAFAKKLSATDMEILVYDKYKQVTAVDFPYVKVVDLKTLQTHADIVSFHLPLTPETKAYCDTDFLNQCKHGVIIINTSRGNVVVTKDLLAALNSGKVSGACLDVFENEKIDTFTPDEHLMYEALYAFENVVLSPHVAGWTHESKFLLTKVLLDKILF